MSKRTYIEGKKFGKLTVLHDMGVISYKGSHKEHRVKCRCDCGNEIIITARALQNESSKGCGRCRQNNYIGERFGKLVIIEQGFYKNYTLYFKCRCDCGNEKVVSLSHLLSGHTTSCNECTKYDVIGKRFSHLVVLEYLGYIDPLQPKVPYYKCKCDCGNIKTINRQRLIRSHKYNITTCGDCYFALPDSYQPEYHDKCIKLAELWRAINSRCNNPNNVSFYRYGGRGIKCEVDKMSFISAFYKDPSYQLNSGLQIDRIDNNGSYKLGNLHWVPSIDNTQNTIRQEKLNYDKCASMLISLNLFQILASINNFDINEFRKIRTDQKVQASGGGRKNDPLYLFIHKSLELHKHFYINRIKKFYEDCGGSITFTEE